MITSTSVMAGAALLTTAIVLLFVFRSLLEPVIKVLGWALAAIVTVAAIVAAAYYGWSYIASAMPKWASTALGTHKPDLGAWIPDFGIWVFVLVLAVVGAFALYYFDWISRRTLTGILLVLVAAVISWFAPWGKLLPDKSPDISALTDMPARVATLAPWLPFIAAALALLIALYLFKVMGGRKLAGAIVLLLAIALLPLVPWGSLKDDLPSLTADNLPVLAGGKCTEKLLEPVPIDSKGVMVPDCQLNFSTSKGCVTVRGTVGEPIKVCTGQKIAWPKGFRALKVWAVSTTEGASAEAEIAAALCPFERPYWNGRCVAAKLERRAAN